MFVKNIRSKILYFFSISLFVLGTGWFWLHKKSKPKEASPEIIKSEVKSNGHLEENAEIIIKDLILKEVEKHKGLEFVINASEGKILNSTDKIECKNITCVLNDNHEKVADLRANNAVIHKTTKNVFLLGNTVGHTCDMTICGQDISYDYSSQMLATNKGISYSHKLFSLIAKESRAYLKNNKIVMSGGVKSEFLNSPTCNGNAD